jgi:predicted transcriptional regulator
MADHTPKPDDGRQTVYLRDLSEPLRATAYQLRRSESAIVREALADWLAKRQPTAADRAAS